MKKFRILKKFAYLGVVLTNNYDDTPEIKRSIAVAINAVVSLAKLWKDKGISMTTKENAIFSSSFDCIFLSEC